MRITVSSVEHEERQLCALREEIKAVEAEQNDTRDAIAAATIRLEAGESRIARLNQEMTSLEAIIHDHQHTLQLRRAIVASVPPELLRTIFIATIPERWDSWEELGYGNYSVSEANRPFTLASVCRRWRVTARATAQLWTYLAVPIPKSPMDALRHLQRVETIIRRSKNRPLEVLLPWSTCPDKRFTVDPCTEHIFTEITSAMSRWRIFEFHMPRDALSVQALKRLRYPTPKLEKLILLGSDSYDDTGLPEAFSADESRSPRRYFPFCPLLGWYDSSQTNVFVNAAAPTQPLPNLRNMEITVGGLAILWLWDALRASPALEVLRVREHHDHNDDNDHIAVPTTELLLSQLKELELDDVAGAWFSAASPLLRMPSLRKFRGACSSVAALGHTFFDGPGKGITTIHVDPGNSSLIQQQDATFFELAPTVQTLVLTDVWVADAFFERLLTPDATGAWLLPQLTSLQLVRCGPCMPTPIGEYLVQFIRTRTTVQEGITPARLATITIDRATVLEEFHRAEINCILGRDNDNPYLARWSECDDPGDVLIGVEKFPADEDEAVMTDDGTEEGEYSDSQASGSREGAEEEEEEPALEIDGSVDSGDTGDQEESSNSGYSDSDDGDSDDDSDSDDDDYVPPNDAM